MASKTRLDISTEKLFNKILLGSLLIHIALMLLVMNVEPPPPPSQEDYTNWVRKVSALPVEEPEEIKPEPELEPEEPQEEIAEAKPQKEAPAKKPAAQKPSASVAEKRAAVRKQLSGAGILGVIGSVSDEEGGLTNVFESGAAVSEDLGKALSERGGVRVTGGNRIGKKGAIGEGTVADIGDVDAGAGESAGEMGGKKGVVPKAFVKSTEPVLKKGGIDERKLRMVLRSKERAIQQCYERGLKSNPKLQGEIVLEWSINTQGRVAAIKLIRTPKTISDKKVIDCVKKIIETARFPKAEKGVVPVRKSFVFQAGG